MKTLTVSGEKRDRRWQSNLEEIAQGLCLLLALWLVIAAPLAFQQEMLLLAFLPPLWIALRHGFHPALLATLLVDATVIAGALLQPAPYVPWPELLLDLALLTTCILLLGYGVSHIIMSATSLRVERDQLKTIVDTTPVGILVFQSDGDCLLVNEAAANIIGAPDLQAMLRQNFYSIHAWRAHGILDMANQVLANGAPQRREFHIVTSFEKEVWIDCQAAPLSAGSQPNLLVVLDDISERVKAETELALHRDRLEELVEERTAELKSANYQLKQMMAERAEIEQALRESEEHFRLLAEHSQDAIFRYDMFPQQHLVYVSPAVFHLTGYTPEEHYANPSLWQELIEAEDRKRLTTLLGTPALFDQPLELRWLHKDGRQLWYEQRYIPIFDEQGQCITIIGIARDITARRAADEELRKLSRAVEQSSVSVTITDAEGHIEYVNPCFTQVTGYSFEDVRGQMLGVLSDEENAMPWQQLSPALPRLWQTLQSGKEWRGEVRNWTKSGTPYWESGVVSPIYDNQGKITHLLAVMEDVTQRKQQDREREAIMAITLALRAADDSEEMLSIILQEITATFDATKTFFIAPDPETGEMIVEAVFETGAYSQIRDVRIPPGEGVAAMVYLTGQPYVSNDALHDPLFAIPELLGEASAVTCVPLIAQEQTIGAISVARLAPMTSQDVRLLVAIADMTATGLQRADYHEETLRYAANLERAVAEQTSELRGANERLQELDQLKSKFVSDVSHELRTPVTNVGLYSRLIRRKPEKQEEYLDILQEEAERLENLVLDILDLARLDTKPTMARTSLNLNELLIGVLAAHQAKADSRRLHLSLLPGDNLPPLTGDATKLVQVANNLVANAINYTPSGFVRVQTSSPDPHTVRFAVEDSGTGIYPEDLPHLFERFYRGPRDQIVDIPGTGLGLSIVKELVELHEGTIDIDSEVGRGSTFTITLPTTLQNPNQLENSLEHRLGNGLGDLIDANHSRHRR